MAAKRYMMMQQQSDSAFWNVFSFSCRLGRLVSVYSLIWLVLAGPEPASWILGIPAILLAVVLNIVLVREPGFSFSPAGVLLFIPSFILLSVSSGIDVLRRSFSPGPRINPGIYTYRTGLKGSARILLTNVISLQPGTLSADLKEDEILIHVLDTGMPLQSNIRNLELRIARIFMQQSAPGGSQ